MTAPNFRAWDKENKEMLFVKQIDFMFGKVVLESYEQFFIDEIELMQSTGVIDKNGKEIFDGDIVKVLNSLYTVFYDSDKGSFRLKPHDKRWHTDYMSNFSSGENFEIIGNMYEGVNDDNS